MWRCRPVPCTPGRSADHHRCGNWEQPPLDAVPLVPLQHVEFGDLFDVDQQFRLSRPVRIWSIKSVPPAMGRAACPLPSNCNACCKDVGDSYSKACMVELDEAEEGTDRTPSILADGRSPYTGPSSSSPGMLPRRCTVGGADRNDRHGGACFDIPGYRGASGAVPPSSRRRAAPAALENLNFLYRQYPAIDPGGARCPIPRPPLWP